MHQRGGKEKNENNAVLCKQMHRTEGQVIRILGAGESFMSLVGVQVHAF